MEIILAFIVNFLIGLYNIIIFIIQGAREDNGFKVGLAIMSFFFLFIPPVNLILVWFSFKSNRKDK